MAGKIYRAKDGFNVDTSEGPIFVAEGDLVREGHEILRAHPDAFEEYEHNIRFDVEDASADPGRKRGERRSSNQGE